VGNLDILETELLSLGVTLPENTKRSLCAYLDELDRWNRSLNLTSLDGRARARHLVAEPLWVARELSVAGQCLDIGSGNGSPGIPWHIGRSLAGTVLIEARQRRATFLRRLTKSLNLSGVTVERGRFEDISGSLDSPDWVTLQGLNLRAGLYEKISSLSKRGTRLVWITSKQDCPIIPYVRLQIPNSDRFASVFRLA